MEFEQDESATGEVATESTSTFLRDEESAAKAEELAKKSETTTQKISDNAIAVTSVIVETPAEESDTSLSARLLRYRARFGITQEELAEMAKLSQPTISIIEKKGHVPKRRTLNTLNAVLETAPETNEQSE